MQRQCIQGQLFVQFLLSEDKTSFHVRQQDMFNNHSSLRIEFNENCYIYLEFLLATFFLKD